MLIWLFSFRPAQCRTEDAIEPLRKYDKIWVVPTVPNDISVSLSDCQDQGWFDRID